LDILRPRLRATSRRPPRLRLLAEREPRRSRLRLFRAERELALAFARFPLAIVSWEKELMRAKKTKKMNTTRANRGIPIDFISNSS
jgi:hypothetical protein